jgi:hypothetical protein
MTLSTWNNSGAVYDDIEDMKVSRAPQQLQSTWAQHAGPSLKFRSARLCRPPQESSSVPMLPPQSEIGIHGQREPAPVMPSCKRRLFRMKGLPSN